MAEHNEYPCTVVRRCSSTGVACQETDRACQEQARDRGLEVNCELPGEFVYCPPNSGRGGDNRGMWILLTVALSIAIGGSSIAWVALRKSRH